MASEFEQLIGGARLDALHEACEIGDELGSGSFSTVYKAKFHETGEDVAVKIVDKSRLEGKEYMLQTEVDILKQVNHHNIINLHEVFESEDSLSMVMEMVSGGELFDQIIERGHYSERDAASVMVQIFEALVYLHNRHIVHRDLKPENVLYATSDPDSPVKLADFGLSKIVGAETILRTACGTPGYVAPEVLVKKKEQRGYTSAVDLWSCGVILYILLCGFPPFYADNNRQLFNDIRAARYKFPSPYWDGISDEAKDLVTKLLTLDPNERLTAEQGLEHVWITTSAPTSLIDGIADRLATYNVKRRLKKVAIVAFAIATMRSLIALHSLVKAPEGEHDEDAPHEVAVSAEGHRHEVLHVDDDDDIAFMAIVHHASSEEAVDGAPVEAAE